MKTGTYQMMEAIKEDYEGRLSESKQDDSQIQRSKFNDARIGGKKTIRQQFPLLMFR